MPVNGEHGNECSHQAHQHANGNIDRCFRQLFHDLERAVAIGEPCNNGAHHDKCQCIIIVVGSPDRLERHCHNTDNHHKPVGFAAAFPDAFQQKPQQCQNDESGKHTEQYRQQRQLVHKFFPFLHRVQAAAPNLFPVDQQERCHYHEIAANDPHDQIGIGQLQHHFFCRLQHLFPLRRFRRHITFRRLCRRRFLRNGTGFFYRHCGIRFFRFRLRRCISRCGLVQFIFQHSCSFLKTSYCGRCRLYSGNTAQALCGIVLVFSFTKILRYERSHTTVKTNADYFLL